MGKSLRQRSGLLMTSLPASGSFCLAQNGKDTLTELEGLEEFTGQSGLLLDPPHWPEEQLCPLSCRGSQRGRWVQTPPRNWHLAAEA